MNEKFKKYLIPLILFVVSYSIYSVNLDQQGIYIDEVFHHGFSIMYYDSIKNGDILNPCITGIGECTMIDLDCAGEVQWLASGGIFKGIFVGLGDELFSDAERVYSADQKPCRPIHNNQIIRGENTPTQDELSAGRFFSPVFAGITIVLAFQIGSLMFNRFVGIIFSTTLITSSLFMLHARILTSEIYVGFFMLLSIYLLLKAYNEKEKFKIKYLVISAIVFAMGLNTKILTIEIFPLLIFIIFIGRTGDLSLRKIYKFFTKRSLAASVLFTLITIAITIGTFPFYYPDPIGQLIVQFEGSQTHGPINNSFSPNSIMSSIFTFSATILPTIDTYYYIFDSENIPYSAEIGHTFSTIPLAFLFFVGIVFIIQKIKHHKLSKTEFLAGVWFTTLFIFCSLITDSYNVSRYFFPLMFPIMLIMAYGIWRLCENIRSDLIKIGFVCLTTISHTITYLVFWKMIYFEPETIWKLPWDINLRESLSEPIVLSVSIIFSLVLLTICIIRIRTSKIYQKN